MTAKARKATTRTASAASAAPTRATTRRAAVKAVGAPAAPTRKGTARTSASANAGAVKATRASKAKTEATPDENVNKFAWGPQTKEADYKWLTAEAAKMGAGKTGPLAVRLSPGIGKVLAEMAESGKWWNGSRALRKAEKEFVADLHTQYEEGTSWMVRDKNGIPKPNGYKQAHGVSEAARKMLLTIHAERSALRRGDASQVIDIDAVWVSKASANAASKSA